VLTKLSTNEFVIVLSSASDILPTTPVVHVPDCCCEFGNLNSYTLPAMHCVFWFLSMSWESALPAVPESLGILS
jgi:hypothetical protein